MTHLTGADVISTSVEYRDQFLERITELLAGATFDTSVPLDDAVDRVMRAAPIDHPYNDDIGPFFTPARAARELNVSRQAISDRMRRGTLIVCETEEGDKVLPTFQFKNQASIAPLIKSARILAHAPVDGWAIATWLSVPQPDLGDLSVRQWVDRGKDTGLVDTLAKQTAAVWSK